MTEFEKWLDSYAPTTSETIDEVVRDAWHFRDAEIATLREELETERIRLAACGVVALANTPESAAKAREMLPKYRSASCDDVARIVDSEITLREQVKMLREVVTLALKEGALFASDEARLQKALAATEQTK